MKYSYIASLLLYPFFYSLSMPSPQTHIFLLTPSQSDDVFFVIVTYVCMYTYINMI